MPYPAAIQLLHKLKRVNRGSARTTAQKNGVEDPTRNIFCDETVLTDNILPNTKNQQTAKEIHAHNILNDEETISSSSPLTRLIQKNQPKLLFK